MTRFLPALLGIVFLTFLLRWNSFTAPLDRDEGEYLYGASLLLSGGLPYRDSYSLKPPLIFYTYALGKLINSTAVWPPRLLAFLSEVATLFIVGLIAKKRWGKREAFIVVPILALMLHFPLLVPTSANTEIFALLPLVFVIYLYAEYKASASGQALFLAGFSAACSILYKPIVVYMLLFIFAVWLWESYRGANDNCWQMIKKTASLIFGGLFATVLILGYFAYKDGLKSFWECAVSFSLAYAVQYGWGLRNLVFYLGSFVFYWPVISLVTIWYFIRPTKGRWWSKGVLVTGLLAIFPSPFGHYYLILMPIWALIITHSINDLAVFLDNKFSLKSSFWFLTMATLVSTALPISAPLFSSPKDLLVWMHGRDNPFLESETLAQKLAEITTPKDLVFIAGSEPQILYYANRWSVSRFVITYPLTINTPKKLEYQQEVINDLRRRPPAAVVVVNRESSGLFYKDRPNALTKYLLTLLSAGYQLQGGFVWTTQGGRWKNKLEGDDLSSASLLLYKRGQKI